MTRSVEWLRAEVREREQRILDLEQAAIQRQDKIRSGDARWVALMQRRATAEERKTKLVASLAARSERRREYLEQRDNLRNRHEAAEREQAELDQIEDRLTREEAVAASVPVAKPSEAVVTNRVIPRGKDTAEEFLLKYEEGAIAVERRFEQFERIAAQRRNAIELEQAKWTALWLVKHAEADSRIEELKKEMREAENPAALDDRWQKFDAEAESLEEQLRIQTKEIKDLAQRSEVERDRISQEEQEIKAEKEKLRNEAKALDQKLIEQKVEMDTLRHHGEVAKLTARDLAKRRDVAQTRLEIATKVLELLHRQLTEAERKLQTLKQGEANTN
jgi:hypothetical protein